MARRVRLEYAGALYHAITRKNQRQRIFRDDRDRTKYLEILANLKIHYSFRIPVYVLMVNHVHLLNSNLDAAGKFNVTSSQAAVGASAAKAERRVVARGTSNSQAPTRKIFNAAAVARCCRCVLALPT